VETGLSAYLEGASTPIPDGVSIDEWVDEYVTPLAAGGCGVPRSQQEEITIDGQSGRVAECPDQVEATVVVSGRLYLFILGSGRSDARAFFDAWMATVDLRPEDAAVPSPTP
jgi:ABC-type Fe3+-hydroxamate transport system substrate-binding protein